MGFTEEDVVDSDALFHLIVKETTGVNPQKTVVNWSSLKKPLTKRNRMGLPRSKIWNFFPLFPQISSLDLSCSGLEILDFDKLVSPNLLSSLTYLDLSRNNWDTSTSLKLWGTCFPMNSQI